MNKKYFLLLSTILLATMPACADYVNVTDKLNVRASAQLNSKIIDTLPRNHYVAVQYKNDDWAYIEYYSKQKYKYGWVKKEYLQPEYIPVSKKKNPTKPTTYTQPKTPEIKYFEMLTYYIKNKKYSNALTIANNYLKDYPNNITALSAQAFLLQTNNNFDGAIISYTKLINANVPALKYDYYFSRGLCYSALKKYSQALADFQALPITYVSSMPNQSRYNYYYYKGHAEFALSLRNEAIFSYTKALEIKQDPELLYTRGLIYSQTYQDNLARQDLKNVINMCTFDQSEICTYVLPRAKHFLSDFLTD